MFKVTLAKDIDFDKLKLPVYASPKMDGIRCSIQGGVAYARSLKPIRQPKLQELVQQLAGTLDGLDGELVSGPPTVEGCCSRTSSCIMSKNPAKWDEDTKLWVFDWHRSGSFKDRMKALKDRRASHGLPAWVQLIPQIQLNTADEVAEAYERFLADGYEGIVSRDPELTYQSRRSSQKVQALMRLKPIKDHEGRLTEIIELMHNANEAEVNELGNTFRSSAKAGKIPAGTLGTMIVEDLETGSPVRIGSFKGLTAPMKKAIFDSPDDYLGRLVKYKSMGYGAKDAPRQGVFLGFRDKEDMGG